MINGWLRADGRKGIRNTIVVAYPVECAHFVASEIVQRFRNTPHDGDVQLIGFPGCYPNEYAAQMMEKLCTHPNVGAVLFISLGCERFDKVRVANAVDASGRPVKTLIIQRTGGTLSEDMEVNAGDIIEGRRSIAAVAQEIRDLVVAVAAGQQTRSEELGHRKFILTYKSFEPIGPACLPKAA